MVTSAISVEFSQYCKCDSIFEAKYLRTHRSGGTKVLRCFPHCCPSHVFNSVCGTSVVARVHGPADRVQQSMTYLRFEASYERPFQVGDTLSEQTILSNLRRQTHAIGEWIASQYDVFDDKTSVRVNEFSPKATSSLGWHYRWVGGSARQQRRATHCLRAYVFERFFHHNVSMLRVVATTQSPTFIVMSYRRACKVCQRQTPEDLEKTSAQCQCEGIYRVSSHGSDNDDENMTPPSSIMSMQQDAMPSALISDMEHAFSIIYYYLSTLDVPAFAAQLAMLEETMQQCFFHGTGPNISSPLFQPFIRAPSPQAKGLEASIASACMLFMSQITTHMPAVRHFFGSNAACLLNKRDLEKKYLAWIRFAYETLNPSVAPLDTTLLHLAQDILRLVEDPLAQRPNISLLRHKIQTYHPTLAFEWFVAQMREMYLAINSPMPSTTTPSPLDGRWRWTSTNVSFLADSSPPSFLTIFRALSMGLSVQQIVQGTSLFITSEHALFPTIWSEFVLDGHPHILRVFANGETTMSCVSDFMYGDYVGRLGPEDPQTVELTLYCWPAAVLSVNRHCYAIRLQSVLHGPNTLSCRVQVTSALEDKKVDYWGMDISERIASFNVRDEAPVLELTLQYARR
ncbi:hypothetical protein SPRG_07674 [Saprolegnia parasitica CBS 223.65]|uniref:Uncharacterized protein n=2 Tax=Saprolegnia parasitica (strain CBS 223.65) TaxID=695850 RepID=A0A067CK83_SAPPC|nr:hypothetical protein SPRG_07674 [Saprolegnia parasitica CBS 223.65]KDO26961.1 hypothetical protein SPRG_07674 [Saprolegnia parasitica CBS 223.65]|eukprot:XP_012202342.1 hypothetical protein SPRG_07674 [Saprolegnia parasitica CBS 223.65]